MVGHRQLAAYLAGAIGASIGPLMNRLNAPPTRGLVAAAAPLTTGQSTPAQVEIDLVTRTWGTQLDLRGAGLPEGVLTTDLQKQSYATMLDLINNPHSDRNNLGAFSDYVGANVKQVVLGAMTAEDAAKADQEELEKGNF